MKQTAVLVVLKSDELITERPFTHLNYIPKDRDVLLYMAGRLCMVLETSPDGLQADLPILIDEPDGRWHRFYVPRPNVLMQASPVFVVGFFGHKRKGMHVSHFGNLDNLLIEQIPTFEGVLSYSTMSLPDGNYGNLVLLADEGIKLRWMEGETHSRAVARSPGYYQSIRIDNGIFPDGILQLDSLRITRVKYYDYREDPAWRAVRELTDG